MKKVLYVAAEAVPFVKTGGLADVAFSLPKALRKMGMDIRIVLPKYKNIPEEFKINMTVLKEINVAVGWRNQYCGIQYLEYEGIPYYFIDNEYYFKRDGIYGFFDDGERFAFFDRAVLELIDHIDFKPDILHCNDWHTGMIIPLLHAQYSSKPFILSILETIDKRGVSFCCGNPSNSCSFSLFSALSPHVPAE